MNRNTAGGRRHERHPHTVHTQVKRISRDARQRRQSKVKPGLRELEKILTFLSYLQYMGAVRPLVSISLGELNELAFDQWLARQVTRLAGKKRCTRSAGNADFAEETGQPRTGNRCPTSGVGELTAEKVPNEPKWGYPLIMVFQRVNIDAFGVAYCKRTQFPIVRHAQRVGADSSCFLPTKPRAGRPPVCGRRRNGSGARAKKRANEANCCQPLVIIIQRVSIDAFGFANYKRTQFPSVRHEKRAGADPILGFDHSALSLAAACDQSAEELSWSESEKARERSQIRSDTS